MKQLLLCIFALFFYVAPSLANDSIRIKITDEDTVGLHTCGVYVKNKWNLSTDRSGYVNIPLSYCNMGDTIQISYMGYENLPIVISPSFLQNKKERVYALTPKNYLLEEISVTGNAEKLFEKKKRNMLLPFAGKHLVHVFANINYTDANGDQVNKSGNLTIQFTMTEQIIVENTCTTDTLLLRQIKESLVLATYIPYSCCFKKFRKLYDVYYLGIQDHHSVFRFDAKPEFVTHPYFAFQKGDEISEIVEVREDGFISKIETRADVKSGKSKSYNLSVDYIDYKRKMAPVYISMAGINEKTYIELTCHYND